MTKTVCFSKSVLRIVVVSSCLSKVYPSKHIIPRTMSSSSSATALAAVSTKKHVLHYFDGAGRAEVIRICLFTAGIGFEDKRFAYSEWKAFKATTPLGSVPVLEIDGFPYVQSTALARYAGTLAGWYPNSHENPLAALLVDQVMESLNELMVKAPKSDDPTELYKLRSAFQANEMTQYASYLESLIQRNGGVGFTSTPNIADLMLSLTVKSIAGGNWNHIEANFFEAYPGIMATVKYMDENEQVKAYYDAKKK